jgi:hypothetical protein
VTGKETLKKNPEYSKLIMLVETLPNLPLGHSNTKFVDFGINSN